jgi:hypothetical protein
MKRREQLIPFLQSLGSVTNVPILSAAVPYDDPKTGEVFIPIIYQVIYIPEMHPCLLCPMQLMLNDVVLSARL